MLPTLCRSLRRARYAPLLLAAPAALLLSAPQAGQAAPVVTSYSNDKDNPTVLTGFPTVTMAGTVVNSGSVSGGVSPTSQYVSFTVPTGFSLQSLNLTQYGASTDGRGFVGIMPGSTWSTAPSFPSRTLPGALAYHHFGTGGGADGALCAQQYLNKVPVAGNNCFTNAAGQSNLLTKSLIKPVGRLQAGTYTMWIQQTGSDPITYEFQAQFSPVPAPLPLLGAAAGWGLSRRLRQRINGGAMAA